MKVLNTVLWMMIGGMMLSGCSQSVKVYEKESEKIMNRPVRSVSEMKKNSGNSKRVYPEWGEVIREEHLNGLPESVQYYLRNTGVVGTKMVRTVYLKQSGEIRQGSDQPWMKVGAVQVYNVQTMEFVWFADVVMNPLLKLKGVDQLTDGHGKMVIKLLDLFKVVNAEGAEIDQGSRMRFVNEMMWFPASYLHPAVSWKEIDENKARLTVDFGNVQEKAVIEFNDNGDIVNFIADRYMDRGEGIASLEQWETPISGYADFGSLRLPSEGYAVWRLEDEDFKYIKLKIEEIQFGVND